MNLGLQYFLQKIHRNFSNQPIIEATVEVPIGEKKSYWDVPCFLNYGYYQGDINPFDGEPLDVYFFNYPPFFTKGQKIATKIFGLLTNDEGDIKLLGVNPKQIIVSQKDINKLVKRESVYNKGTKAEIFNTSK